MRKKLELSQKFSSFVVKYRWIFTLIFVALAVFGAIMIPKTKVLYDLSVYTPKGGILNRSITLMKQEFDDKGSASVMFAGVNIDQANIFAEELSQIEGVESVSFDSKNNYKNSDALISIILSDYDSTDGANATIERIIKYIDGKNAYLTGQSSSSYYTRKAAESEVLSIAIIVVVMVICILFFTSKTYFELVIMLFVFGIAAIINFGTNFLLGEISYISNSIGMVLQLVLTIDYSVIFLHRFLEERQTLEPREAAKIALGKAIPEVLSSSLTTIAGMCALILMTLPIGKEIGLALTKGIIISILSVIFFMPALLVFFAKPIDKTKHKSFVPQITKLAKKTLSARYIIIAVFAIITTLGCIAQFQNTYSFNMNSSHSIVSQKERISQSFGTMNTFAVIIPNNDVEKEKELTDYVMSKPLIDSVMSLNTIELIPDYDIRLKDKLTAAEFTLFAKDLGFTIKSNIMETVFQLYMLNKNVDITIPINEYEITIYDLLMFIQNTEYLTAEQIEQMRPLKVAINNFESENYTRIMFNINAPVESPETSALIDELVNELGQFYGEENFYLAGESVMIYEMDKAFPTDNLKVVLFTSGFILLILLLTFRNLLLPLIMMLTIQSGIWINFALTFIMGSSIMFISYLVISAIQMGATIDYAIILTNRFQVAKTGFTDLKDAMAESLNAVFPTIITSGVILTATGFIIGIASSEPSISQLGMLLGVGTLLSIVMVLCVLPQLLYVCNKLVDKAKVTFKIKGKKQK